ncbi:alpha/beta hydrolase [Legionella londiniensis]|uniref:Carboxylesterase n=1 Tax=Legionella londiniensis TaxID=45068 RepID=A0A0W0VIW8_9GAMM|nr:alpha/beta fold hydrolase [Legionella londiniensis]KTD19766.1 carboxylesterase [Legionella londiniensis]STX92323.1 carboxylesterase [Legionella londiniensis]
MNIHDFRYLWRGKTIGILSPDDAHLLKSIDQRLAGRERALLLLHGFSSSPAVFRELSPALIGMYDAVVCPVLPGHGETLEAFARAEAKDWLRASENALSSLQNEYEEIDVMGLSLGGLLACHLSTLFPVRRLYLLAPALALQLNIPPYLRLARILHRLGFQYLRNRAGNLFSHRFAELAYRQLPLTSIIEVLNLIQEFRFNKPSCPVDVFLGKFDKVINSRQIEKIFSDLGNARIHWLNHSAHVLPLDGDIDTIIARVRENA